METQSATKSHSCQVRCAAGTGARSSLMRGLSCRVSWSEADAAIPLYPDIFVPEGRIVLDEIAHEPDAFFILQNVDNYPLRAEMIFAAHERHVLPDHDLRDLVEQDRAAAHRARGERGVNRAAFIDGSLLASGVFEAVHFPVMNYAAVLHPLIV